MVFELLVDNNLAVHDKVDSFLLVSGSYKVTTALASNVGDVGLNCTYTACVQSCSFANFLQRYSKKDDQGEVVLCQSDTQKMRE